MSIRPYLEWRPAIARLAGGTGIPLLIGHDCAVGNRCLIGMGATVMDGAVIGDEVIVGAGSLVPARKALPAHCVALKNDYLRQPRG